MVENREAPSPRSLDAGVGANRSAKASTGGGSPAPCGLSERGPLDVYVLVTCKAEKDLPISLLVFDTIRVGFPTAQIHVIDNASDFGNTAIAGAFEKAATEGHYAGSTFRRTLHRLEHGDFIRDILENAATGPTVFVDTDMIFWENCEDIAVPAGKLYGGRFIPESTECGWRMPARIHPSLFFVPDPAALRAALRPFQDSLWYFKPFQGYTAIDGGTPICWDTCASLYAALPEAAFCFGEAELDRYDHLFAGTYADKLETINMDTGTAALIRASHAVALGPARASLRGLWREQFPSEVRRRRPFWRYWSGVLENAEGEAFGFMHAVFEAPGLQTFRHTAVVNRRTGDVRAGAVPWVKVDVPDLPVPLVPRHHKAGMDYHTSDTVVVENLAFAIDGKRYEGLSGTLWYDAEQREIKPGEGWRWISMRLKDGRSIMLYDRSDATRRYAVRKDDGEWGPIEAVVYGTPGEPYQSTWEVTIGSENFRVLSVAEGQEIVDNIRGLRYLEALCTVETDGKDVGTAYVEIVPAVALPVIQSIPSDAEMHLRWCKGNKEAAFLMDLFGWATQVADDLVDADREHIKTKKGRTYMMSRLLYCLLIQIPGNPFFRANEAHFVSLFPIFLTQWEASEEWATARKLETRMFAYVTRAVCARLFEQVAYVIGGIDWMSQVTREIHEYYYGESGRVESFAEWDKEPK